MTPAESAFRAVFHGATTGVVIADLDGCVVEANPSFLHMIGRTADEIIGRHVSTITHPDDRAESRAELERLLSGRVRAFRIDQRYLHADGSVVQAHTSVSLVAGVDGAPLYAVASVDDWTTARDTIGRLSRSETLRRLAGKLALVGGWSVEATTERTIYWSEEVFDVLDAVEGDAPSLETINRLYPEADRLRMVAALDDCILRGVPFDLELQIHTFSGRLIPARVIGEPERDASGRIVRAVGAFQDISEIARVRDEAAQAGLKLVETLETMSDAVYVLDDEWRFTFLNGRAEHLLERRRSELIGRSVWAEFPEAVTSELFELFRRAREHHSTEALDEFFYPPLGKWFAVVAAPSPNSLAVYFRDVTESHHARDALVLQAELLDAAQDAIVVCDAVGLASYWNRGAERVYGMSADEAIGRPVRDLWFEYPEQYDEAIEAVYRDGHWAGEQTHRTRSGELLVVAARWTLAVDAEGRPHAMLAINTDVTFQRRVEQQLMRAQRLETIGTLASGVAHDLNNVLSPISLAAGLLADRVDGEDLGLVGMIESSARRGGDLVSNLLSFARGIDLERAPMAIGEVVDSIAAIVRDTFPKDISLEVRMPEGRSTIIGTNTQLHQVLMNLVVNARDAMPDGGRLAIDVSHMTLDADQIQGRPGCEPGPYVVLAVRDSGVGMAPETMERIFDPFFTTKPHGAGTGLGLPTTTAIVADHHGFVTVESEPDRGSTFRVFLPRVVDNDVGQVVATHPSPSEAGAGGANAATLGTVLVVDDEEPIRLLIRKSLEAAGYRVLDVADGAAALRSVAERPGAFDAVIVDMMMPLMDGPSTIAALRTIAPDVRVIAASGLVNAVPDDLSEVHRFLSKPFTLQELLDCVAEVLGDRSGPCP
jgi:PAS domain S-box-containing protein